ncbi:hypothetical protein CmeUKMEL1_02920 [Cryptosporidium meleagridis]|uniref:Integral membrane protein n=1 Tax=Cryptosporidium meleagridis TaxID=93969 RepID=A0A2P4YXK3_9CRYT|nr:hypothetical protein CmeUKMEL1_02920 [Cryptosporidium meleagridis]
MASFLYFLLLSVFFVWDVSNYGEDYGLSSEIISFIKIKENTEKEFLVSSIGTNSVIIVDAGSGSRDSAVLSVFGDALSTQFDEIQLSEEEKNELNRIFRNDCNADIFSYLILVLSKLFISFKEYECKLRSLEKSYESCRGHGTLMRRIRKCKEVEETYRIYRRGWRDTSIQARKFGKKAIECVQGISKGLWLAGKHTDVENEGSTVQCTEQELLNERCKLTIYKVFNSALLTALISASISASKCKEKRCRKMSSKCKCIILTVEQLEENIDGFEKRITEKNTFIRSCTKYLMDTSGSISTAVVRAPSEETNKDLKEVMELSKFLVDTQ